MKAFVVKSGVVIDPLGDYVADVPVGNRPLREIQDEVLRAAGFEVERVESLDSVKAESYLLTYDNVFFTKRVLRAFLRKAARMEQGSRLALPESLYIKNFSGLQEIEPADDPQGGGAKMYSFNVFLVKGGGPGDCKPVRVDYRELKYELPVPPNICGRPMMEHPITSSVVMHINHWVHLLWANNLSVQIRWAEHIVEHPFWSLWQLLGAISLSRNGFKWRLLRRLNKTGKGCDIHPTARVEASFLGDKVTVGAYALVRGSILGDGCVVEERANVNYTVAGERTFISKNSTVVGCMGFADSDMCVNGMQFCVAGRGSALTAYVRPIDISFKGEIKVPYKGQMRSIGTNILGACFGHGCFVGPEVYILPGRAIPNGAFVGAHPSKLLSRPPAHVEPGKVMYVEDGTLKEVE